MEEERLAYAHMVSTPTATPLSPSRGAAAPASRVFVAPAGAKEGDVLDVDGTVVRLPPGVSPGDSFIVAEQAPVVATPVPTEPSDEEVARETQRAELTLASSQILLEAAGGYGSGHPHLTVEEQKLLDSQWTLIGFSGLDMFGTIILTVYSPWCLLFIIAPFFGYWGAKQFNHRKISLYLGFCLLKVLFNVIILMSRLYSAVLILILQIVRRT